MEGRWLDPCVAPDFVAALRKQFRHDACCGYSSDPENNVENSDPEMEPDILRNNSSSEKVCQEMRVRASGGVDTVQIFFDDPEFLGHLPRFNYPPIPLTIQSQLQRQNSNKHAFGSGSARKPYYGVGTPTVLTLDPTVNNIRRRLPQAAFPIAAREAPATIDERLRNSAQESASN